MEESLDQILARVRVRPEERVLRSNRTYAPKDLFPIITEIGRKITPSFAIDSVNGEVYEKFAAWLLNKGDLDTGKGIYLAGSVGTGKSVCMRVMRILASELDLKIKVGDSVDYLAWKSWRTDEVCSQFAATGDLSPFKQARVACFDDLGAEPMETLYMGNRTNVMREIIEYRGDHPELITLFTSNVPIGKLGAIGERVRYGQRAQSRIIQMCNYLVLGGTDRRK